MSDRSAFDKNHVTENTYIEPSGVLDQLNLPSAVVAFLQKYKRILYVSGVVIAIIVVAGSIYQSFHKSRIEDSTSRLAIAMATEGEARVASLKVLASEFDGTPAALWANVELGHQAMKDGKYSEAEEYYTLVKGKISTSNPMFGLLNFGLAQAQEAGGRYDAASSTYAILKEIAGYGDEGFMGMARVLEADGKNKKALAVYEEYLGTFLGKNKNPQLTQMIREKITRLSSQE